MKKVTIIIPVYNTDKYLKKAIESCINQTLSEIEIIIVNDGSTDNSLCIAQEFEKKHENIRIITTENRGLSEARNIGLSKAEGKYIYFLDSDDWIELEGMECCYNLAEEKNLEMVLFDSKVEIDTSIIDSSAFDCTYYQREHIVQPDRIYTGKEFVALYANKGVTFVQAWLVFIKREFLIENQIRFLPNAYYEDVSFHFICMMVSNCIMYIPQSFHVRLYRENSIMTSSLNPRKINSVYEIIIEMYSAIIKRNEVDDIWKEYVFQLTKGLSRLVFGKIKKDDKEYIKKYKTEINKLQYKCIYYYYNILNTPQKKVSSISKVFALIREIIVPLGWVAEEIFVKLNKLLTERDNIIVDIFRKLPLDKAGIKVGIYGSGRHAEYLLKRYEEQLGNIKADIFFIDSNKESYNSTFNNYPIINVKDLNQHEFCDIVIFSYFYEEEMNQNIISIYGSRYKIHRIYNGDKEPLDGVEYIETYKKLLRFKRSKVNRIILINTPEHTNIGDHMIAYAELKFLNKYLPDYEVLEVSNKYYREKRKDIVFQTNVDDIVVITGGGFLGSLWPYSGQNVYSILEDFQYNKIIILPQTMYFEENEDGERQKQLACKLMLEHKNIHICLREIFSFKRSEDMLKDKVETFLMPDMALTLNFSNEAVERKGICICLRTDKEGIVTELEKDILKEYFHEMGEQVEETSMHWNEEVTFDKRIKVITDKINEFKSSKLVVTDALHCMISCAISATPCIALNNINRKLEGIYKTWISDLKYIRFIDNYKDVLTMEIENWQEIFRNNYYDKSYEKYLEHLADIIQN